MALRDLTDDTGTVWQVWDVHPTSAERPGLGMYAAGYGSGWLCFSSDGERRRLAPLPEAWDRCTDAEMLALLAQAEPVRRRAEPAAEPPPA